MSLAKMELCLILGIELDYRHEGFANFAAKTVWPGLAFTNQSFHLLRLESSARDDFPKGEIAVHTTKYLVTFVHFAATFGTRRFQNAFHPAV